MSQPSSLLRAQLFVDEIKTEKKKGIFVVVLGDGSGTEGTQMGASNTRLPVPSNLT